LFAGSDTGAERMAILYTTLANCHLHHIDPQAYLTDVVVKLQGGWPMARIDELLPQFWKQDRPTDEAKKQPDQDAKANDEASSVAEN
jgi:hypothetical protein